ncbi:MAG: hypothetical protein ACYTXY_34915, partial [Nostoc sp.]
QIHLSIDCVNCDQKYSFYSQVSEIITKKSPFPEKISIRLELEFSGLDLNQVLSLVVSTPFRWMS